ncbi:MAG: hypothetical protein IH978_10225 [Nitrospinae bacterium]|nr:hypothetical protein [Nitrospinota bacterium]
MGHPATPDKIMQLGMAYWGSKTLLGLLNISGPCPIDAPGKPACISGRECSKKHALSLSEGSSPVLSLAEGKAAAILTSGAYS